MTRIEMLRKLYKENGLGEGDSFVLKRGNNEIPIITRSGIEKIQFRNEIEVHYELAHCSDKLVAIKAIGSSPSVGLSVETFGEASAANTTNPYPIAIAEKRALSRCVLKICGMYQYGALGQDELSDVFEYDAEPILQLIESSTFDETQRKGLILKANDLKDWDEYQALYNNLEANQLAPMDRPHGRMSAKEISKAIPT